MAGHSKSRKLNNKGSAMVLVLTVISFIAILGAITMSTALLNVRIRGFNRSADKNFYYLETALDEIYAQTGRAASEILKEEYATILSGLYKTDLDTNEKANKELKKQFMEKINKEFEIITSDSDEVNKGNCVKAAGILRGFATTFVKDEENAANLRVTVESITYEKEEAENFGLPDLYSGISFNGLCLTYVNPETDAESALTVDLKIDIPYVRFINGGGALLDYVLVSNEAIEIGSGTGIKGSGDSGYELNGNIYGKQIVIDNADVQMNSSLLTAAGNLTVKQGGSLNIGPDAEAEGQSRVWADGIELNSNASISSEKASFFVRDDLTLLNNQNTVKLGGSYYGYGNEGNNDVKRETKDKSSAILLNDKGSSVDLRKLDFLMLAGRAYLKFNSETDKSSQYIYPMGESLAVRATQSMYLIPEKYITVKQGADTVGKTAGINPILFPDDTDEVEISVNIPDGIGGVTVKTGRYTVTANQLAGKEGAVRINTEDPDTAAFLVALHNKIYVYYNFVNDRKRSDYFNWYLENQADSFELLLEKGGIRGSDTGKPEPGQASGDGTESGIFMNESGELLTSGSLYQVTGKGDAENSRRFELLSVGQSEIKSSLTWVQFEEQLESSFTNLKDNLAETKRVTGARETKKETAGIGKKSLLPMGNYVRVLELEKLDAPIYLKSEKGEVALASGDVEISLNADGTAGVELNRRSGSTRTVEMEGGLIVAGGDVTIKGDGVFNGLIIAKGGIKADGEIILNADPQTYEPLLEDQAAQEPISSDDKSVADYFYDYSDAASTVLNNYEDFVTKENWSRTGLEQGGGS